MEGDARGQKAWRCGEILPTLLIKDKVNIVPHFEESFQGPGPDQTAREIAKSSPDGESIIRACEVGRSVWGHDHL
jgi:hypothetical protein